MSATRKAAGTSLDDLLIVAALDLERTRMQLTFEHLVARCFELFPERFALRGYPQWPDSNVVNKSWLRARTDRHWLVGSVREGFRLTPEGRRHAERLAEGGTRGRTNVPADRRTREGRLLQALRQTAAFQEFHGQRESGALDLADVADALLAPENTSVKTLVRNSAQFRAAAVLYEDKDVERFLDMVDAVLEESHSRTREGYAGGMMQRKAGSR